MYPVRRMAKANSQSEGPIPNRGGDVLNHLPKIGVAGLALWIAWAAPHHAVVAPPTSASKPVIRPQASSGVFRGMAVQLYTGEECWQRFGRLIPEIADLGADTALVVIHGFQDHAASENLHWDGPKTPTPEELLRIVQHAHAHGLRVILMPIVLLEYPRGTEWRGRIKPPDLDAWWKRYCAFILHFARVAEKGNVELLMIGSELVSLENSTARWRQLIGEVKQFYRGKLGYSANWDHYKQIEFWDQLDQIGMTSYYQLSDNPSPKLEDVVKAWEPIKKEIMDWRREIGRPIMFTEAGWCSQEGASVEAWNYYHKQECTPAGLEEQATLYKAFMQVWGDEPGIGGIIWWEWTPDEGGPKDYNYTPRAKPAEKILREWFERKRREIQSRPRPASQSSSSAPAPRK